MINYTSPHGFFNGMDLRWIVPTFDAAIGTIFVVSLIMGDFITVQAMSGGQSASVGLAMNNKRALLQYPAAAADSIILLCVVLGMVAILMRTINIRKEL